MHGRTLGNANVFVAASRHSNYVHGFGFCPLLSLSLVPSCRDLNGSATSHPLLRDTQTGLYHSGTSVAWAKTYEIVSLNNSSLCQPLFPRVL